MRDRQFMAGATLFVEGDHSDHAYVVRSGRVEVTKRVTGGAVRLAIIGPGDVVGEMGLLEEQPRSATATALEPVVADEVDRREFERLLRENPDEAMHLLSALFERLRTTNQMVSQSAAAAGQPAPIPRARLLLDGPEAGASLPADGVEVTVFPYCVGRRPEADERARFGINHLEIEERAPHKLALYHFALDLGDGGLIVRDRGTTHGTRVNGRRIGAGAKRDAAPLQAGENEIAAGLPGPLHGDEPPAFRFKVLVG